MSQTPQEKREAPWVFKGRQKLPIQGTEEKFHPREDVIGGWAEFGQTGGWGGGRGASQVQQVVIVKRRKNVSQALQKRVSLLATF